MQKKSVTAQSLPKIISSALQRE